MENFHKNNDIENRKIMFILLLFIVSSLLLSSKAEALIRIVSNFIDMLGNSIYNVGNLNATGWLNSSSFNGTYYGDGSNLMNINTFNTTYNEKVTDNTSWNQTLASTLYAPIGVGNIIISGGTTASQTTDGYFNPDGHPQASTGSYDEELGLQIPVAMKLRNLTIWIDTTVGASTTCNVTIRSATSCAAAASFTTIAQCPMATGVNTCQNNSLDVQISANDCLNMFYDENTGGTCTGAIHWSFILNG